MTAQPPDPTEVQQAPEPAQPPAPKKAPFLLRLTVPAWLALLLIVVVVLVGWFITGPARSTARSVDRSFSGTQQVEIKFCMSNQQAQEVDRAKAMADLKKHLQELGVANPEMSFTSPCPIAPQPSGQAGSPQSTPPPASAGR